MSGYLTMSDGRTVELRHDFLVGRGKACDLAIDDTKASRRHARFIVEAGVVEVEDLSSSNGTFLNGKEVTRRMLRPGDKLQIGATILVYQEEVSGGGGAGSAGSAIGGAGASIFEDEDELFGDGPAAAPEVPKPPPQPAPRAEPPKTAPAPAAEPTRPGPPQSAPPKPSVVEFADEVVEVRQAVPRPQAAARAPAGEAVAEAKPRVLQYSKNAQGHGVLGDDVGQMSGGMRALVFALVLVGMGAVAWLVVSFVR